MSTYRNIAVSVIGATLFSGCTSWVTVTSVKEHPKAKGFRYSLATPYLLVAPANDGTMSYEWLSLPDTSRQYAIRVHSLLATNTTDLTLDHSILTKLAGKSDSAALATEVLAQAGSASEAKAKAKLKEQQDAKTADKAAQDKLQQSLDSAESAERTSDVALQKAQAKVDLLQSQKAPDADKLLEAQTNLKLAQIDHDAAQKDVDRINGLISVSNGSGSTSSANTGTPPEQAKAWGPLLFRVVQDGSKVTLQAVNRQSPYGTYGEKPKSTGILEVTGTWDPSAKSLTLALKSGGEFPLLNADRLSLNRGDSTFQTAMTPAASADKATVAVTFKPVPTKGSYHLQLVFQKQGVAANVVDFEVP